MPRSNTASSSIQTWDSSTTGSYSNVIWSSWNTGWTTTNSATTSDSIWGVWCNSNTISGSNYGVGTDSAVTWRLWNHGWQPTSARVYGFPAVHRELTPEERAARAAEDERRRLEYEAQQAEKKIANDNAKKLLLSVLNEEQKKDWAAHGHFYLHVGERKYRIKRGRSGNVELVDPRTNEPLERFCAHPIQAVPDEDTAVAQMMYLKYDEQRFIGLANSHWTKQGHESLKRRMAA